MSCKYRTDEDYEQSGRVPFWFYGGALGLVKIWAFKEWRARYEFKRKLPRVLRQREEQLREVERTEQEMRRYRRHILTEQRKIERQLGILDLDHQSLFEADERNMADDAKKREQLNITDVRTLPVVKKQKKRKKAEQLTLDLWTPPNLPQGEEL